MKFVAFSVSDWTSPILEVDMVQKVCDQSGSSGLWYFEIMWLNMDEMNLV